MDMSSGSKLNRLQQELPEGLLVDAAWMEAHGYSSALRSQYVRAGWLDSPARRVYRRSRGPLTWQQVVVSLQAVLDLPLTVGGRTALEQEGYAHYLSAEMREVHLYGPKRPPTWLASLPLDVTFHWAILYLTYPLPSMVCARPDWRDHFFSGLASGSGFFFRSSLPMIRSRASSASSAPSSRAASQKRSNCSCDCFTLPSYRPAQILSKMGLLTRQQKAKPVPVAPNFRRRHKRCAAPTSDGVLGQHRGLQPTYF